MKTFIKRHLIAYILTIIIISAVAAYLTSGSIKSEFIKSETKIQTDATLEKYKKETGGFNNCELGDLVGDDVNRIKYKGYDFDYHTSDFSKEQIEGFADECIYAGIKNQYQADCCIRYMMYPDF